MEGLIGGFIRVETYSREVAHMAKGKKTTSGAVIAEATRQEGFTGHIDEVAAPTLIYGIDPVEAYDEALARLELERTEKGAKYRKDATVLLGGVASYYKPREAVNNDEDKVIIEEWKKRTIDFLKLEFGTNLRSVIEHHDEGYPHIHFYIIGDKVGETRKLHPGMKAEQGIENKSERLKAYGTGLTTFQDNYYSQVSAYVGMNRTGPSGTGVHLTRKQWKKERIIAKALQTKLKTTDFNYQQSIERMNKAENELDNYLDMQADMQKTIAKEIRRQVNEIKQTLIKEWSQMMDGVVELRDEYAGKLKRFAGVKGVDEHIKETEGDSGYIVAEGVVSDFKKRRA